MSTVDVTVIVAVYNGLPYVQEAIESLVAQTLDPARTQILIVDDGSTDGTPELVATYAAEHPHIELVSLERTGSPAKPRNVGLDHARGRYVFFFDADDVLVANALEDMVRIADANGTDIVVPKQGAIGARAVPIQAFRETLAVTDIYGPDVYRVLGPVKLFRRTMIEAERLRFPLGYPRKSDVPFGVETYLHARAISVLADQDYVLVRLRDDGGNLTVTRTSIADHLPVVRFVFDYVPAHVAPGAHRDRLMVRHFRTELVKAVIEGFPGETDESMCRACFDEFAGLAREYCHDTVLAALPPRERVIAHLLREGRYEATCELAELLAPTKTAPAVQHDGRLYLAYPGFRDARWELPDTLFKVGPGSCLGALFDHVDPGAPGAPASEAAAAPQDHQLRFTARLLAQSPPHADFRLFIRKVGTDATVDLPVCERDVEPHGDVPQALLRVRAGDLLGVLGACADGLWSVHIAGRVGDVDVESAVTLLDSGAVPLRKLLEDAVRGSDAAAARSARRISLSRTPKGQMRIALGARGQVSVLLRRTSTRVRSVLKSARSALGGDRS